MSPTIRRARILACAALALPILIVCSPFLFTSRTLVGKDFQEGYGPLFEFARESAQQDGALPRWNPRHFAGVPFVGNPQAVLSYPPNALFLALPATRAFGWLTFLHLLVAAGGMYRLSRGFGARRDGAVLGGLSYALSQTLLLRVTAGHYPYFVTICLAPLLLHLVRLLIDRPRPLHAAGTAVAGAAVLLGGSPQFILHLGLLAGAMAAWRIAALRRQGKPWRPAAGTSAGALAAGIALASLHLLPAVGLAAESSRTSGDQATMLAPFGDFDAKTLVGFLLPGFPWRSSANLWLWHEKALYAGLLPLAMAFFALFRNRGGPTIFFAAAAGAALLAAVGPSLPVHHLLSLLPFYAKFRIPERIVWIVVLSLSLLASRGWSAWRECADRRKPLATAGGIAVIAALLIWIGFGAPREAALFGLTAAATLAALALPSRFAIGAAAFVLSVDLCGNVLARTTLSPSGELPTAPWYGRVIGPERADFRLLDLTDTNVGASVSGFRLLRCGGYPIPGRLAEYYAGAWKDPAPDVETLPSATVLKDVEILRSLNVKWIVTSGPPLHPSWRRVAQGPTSTLYEDPGARPFASTTGGGDVTWRRPAVHRIALSVRAEGPGRVVLREMAFPGWRAARDGAEVPIHLEQGLMMALDAPAGRSEFELEYAPPSRTKSRILFGFGVVAIAGLLGQELRLRRRASPGA